MDEEVKKPNETNDNDVTLLSDPMEGDENEQTLVVNFKESVYEKTSGMFSLDDISKNLDDEIADIPEVNMEEMTAAGLSKMMAKTFLDRSEAERLEINRKFLQDAEPFRVERLIEELKKKGKGLSTGFKSLDPLCSIPGGALTVVTGEKKHGKSIFLMNLLLNMIDSYPDSHFLFYTYEESRWDVETKLINISGDHLFPEAPSFGSNLACWKEKLVSNQAAQLIEKSRNESAYVGLKKFSTIAGRIHIIDGSYNITELQDSIRAFDNALKLGGVFIDYFQKIPPHKTKGSLPRQQQLYEISEELRNISKGLNIPIICASRFTLPENTESLPEFDKLQFGKLENAHELEQIASLIIGLQNYPQSKFMGSNAQGNFVSEFYGHPLGKAGKMPSAFTGNAPRSVILAKIMKNREGTLGDVELLYTPGLLKMGDLTPGDIEVFRRRILEK